MAGERVHVLSSALYSTTLDTCIYWYLLKMQPCKFYKILVTSNLSCLCNQEMKLDDDAMNVEKYVVEDSSDEYTKGILMDLFVH